MAAKKKTINTTAGSDTVQSLPPPLNPITPIPAPTPVPIPAPPGPLPVGACPAPPNPAPCDFTTYPCGGQTVLAYSNANGWYCAPANSVPQPVPQPIADNAGHWYFYAFDCYPDLGITAPGWGFALCDRFPVLGSGVGCGGGGRCDEPPACTDPECNVPDQPPPPPPPQCDTCLQGALDALAQALQALADQLNKKVEFSCDMLDGCVDHLVDLLKDKIFPPAKTCDECCKRIELGLATAAECAAVSANCTCSQCIEQCTSDDDGKCCSGCGQKDCVCQNTFCVPKEQKEQWWCWVGPNDGDIATCTCPDAPPNVDNPEEWTRSGPFDTYEDAFNNCPPSTTGGAGGDQGGIPRIKPGSNLLYAACSLDRYVSKEAAGAYLAGVQAPAYQDTVIATAIASARHLADQLGDIPIIAQLLEPIAGPALGASNFSGIASEIICGAIGCSSTPVQNAIVNLVAFSAGEQIVNMHLPELKLPLIYGLNAATRLRVPAPGEALSYYLNHQVERETVDACFGAAGYCDFVADAAIESAAGKPSVIELRNMRNRKAISPEDFNEGMRQLGFLDQELVDRIYSIMEVRPSLSEVLHMMIRDADNKKVKETFDFDERFDDKFGDTLKKWTEDQQIPLDVVKMAYRSHWDIPSKSELFEFVRRLRNEDGLWSSNGWEADLDAALTHNNVLPHWFEFYKKVLYHPLGRQDIRRSYQLGSLDDDQAKTALQQLGYDDNNTDLLHQFLVRLKQQAAYKHEAITEWVKGEIDGSEVQSRMGREQYTDEQINSAMDAASIRFASSDAAKAFIRGDLDREAFSSYLSSVGLSEDNISRIMDVLAFVVRDRTTEKMYAAGILDRTIATQRMIDNGVAPSVASTVIFNIDDSLQVETAHRCKAAIKKRYLTGGISGADAQAELRGVGISQEAAEKFTSSWGCEKQAKDKHVAATTLCGWFGRGAISGEDFIQRLVNVGFTRDDAQLLLSDCADRLQTKEAARQAKEAAQRERDQRAAQAKADRAESKGRRVAAQLEKARNEKVRLHKQRQVQFLQVTKNLTKKCLCTDSEVIAGVLDQSNKLEAAGFTLDEALRIMLQASEAFTSGAPFSYFEELVSKFSVVVSATEAESISPSEPNIGS